MLVEESWSKVASSSKPGPAFQRNLNFSARCQEAMAELAPPICALALMAAVSISVSRGRPPVVSSRMGFFAQAPHNQTRSLRTGPPSSRP